MIKYIRYSAFIMGFAESTFPIMHKCKFIIMPAQTNFKFSKQLTKLMRNSQMHIAKATAAHSVGNEHKKKKHLN